MSTPAHGPATGLDLAALDAITDAVESGAGLPEIVRAAARALDASLVLTDRAGAVLAVAARSPADERSMLDDAAGVDAIELRVADAPVGTLRMRARGEAERRAGQARHHARSRPRSSACARPSAPPSRRWPPSCTRCSSATSRAARTSSGERASWASTWSRARASSSPAPTRSCRPRTAGASACSAWPTAGRAPCSPAPSPCSRGAPTPSGPRSWSCFPGADDATAARAADAILRELQSALPGHTFALGRSRPAPDPVDLHRAGAEALLAANVVEGDADRPVLAFEESGAYRLLLSAMSEDPAELQRFYAETVEPLVAYDEQYETGLVQTRRGVPRGRRQRGRARPSASSPTATRSATGSSA